MENAILKNLNDLNVIIMVRGAGKNVGKCIPGVVNNIHGMFYFY